MHPRRAAPPAADSCLTQPYSSRPKQKGGTIIAEGIGTLAEQKAALAEPDRCRPKRCVARGCRSTRLHVHERRERRPRQLVVDGEPVAVVEILIFICAICRATWRVLPAFLARCLWRTWEVVEGETVGEREADTPPVPRRTRSRWRSRLVQAARLPLEVLATAGGWLREVAMRAGLDANREELMQCFRRSVGALAVLLHRLSPGVRLL